MFVHKIIQSLIQALLLSIIYGFLKTSLIFAQGQLLQDEGFELSTPNGTFPDAGYWKNSDAGGGADASCTTTAAHSGNNGLWEYTGNETWAWWSGPYQEFPSSTGMVHQGSAWIRTPSVGEGGSWVDGSKASVRIVFLNSSRSVLTYNESPVVTTIGSSWAIYSVTSEILLQSEQNMLDLYAILKSPKAHRELVLPILMTVFLKMLLSFQH